MNIVLCIMFFIYINFNFLLEGDIFYDICVFCVFKIIGLCLKINYLFKRCVD